jgi:hypothetical protein
LDLYSLGVIILESVLPKNWIFSLRSQKQLLNSALRHLTKDGLDPKLGAVLSAIISEENQEEVMQLADLDTLLHCLQFPN